MLNTLSKPKVLIGGIINYMGSRPTKKVAKLLLSGLRMLAENSSLWSLMMIMNVINICLKLMS